jgi:hypothetical protein
MNVPVATLGGDVDKAISVLTELAEGSPSHEVPLLQFVRRMVDLGFNSDQVISLVDELIRDHKVSLTNRYYLRVYA